MGEIKIDKGLKIQWMDPADMTPNPRNHRKHGERQRAVLNVSLGDEGWIDPIIFNKRTGRILDGHLRAEEAIAAGVPEVPVIVLDVDETTERRILVRHDRIGALADLDLGVLKENISGLADLDIGIIDLGWDGSRELAEFARQESGDQDSDGSELNQNAEPVTIQGNIWSLGNHRLCCGDATSKQSVDELLKAIHPHLMVTEPPYGVKYDPTWRDRDLKAEGKVRSFGIVQNDDRCDWREAWDLFPGDVAYVWHSSLAISEVKISLEAAGFVMRSSIIWNKQHFAISRGDYHWKHEPCWYCVRKGKTSHYQGDRKQTTVWDIENACAFGGEIDDGKTNHSTQKPIECMRRPIINNSAPGDWIYDPFGGSGTTLMAAEMTGRFCAMMELDPVYCDMIISRWQKYTGKNGKLLSNGRDFAEVAMDRTDRNCEVNA